MPENFEQSKIENDGELIKEDALNEQLQSILSKVNEIGVTKFAFDELGLLPAKLHPIIADKLIEAGKGDDVFWCRHKFEGLDCLAMADKLIETGQEWVVLAHIDDSSFQNLDREALINKIVETNRCESVAKDLLRNGEVEGFLHLPDSFVLPDNFLDDPFVIKLTKDSIVDQLLIKQNIYDTALLSSIKSKLNISDKEFQSAISEEFIKKANTICHPGIFFQAMELFGQPSDLSLIIKTDSNDPSLITLQRIINLGVTDHPSFTQFFKKHSDYIDFLANNNLAWNLTAEEMKIAENNNLKSYEMHYLKTEVNFAELDDNRHGNKEARLFEALEDFVPLWQDQENISGPFQEGAEYFGYDKMFNYIDLRDRHDTLYNFRKITAIAKESGLDPKDFYGKILNAVSMDDGLYGEDDLKGYQLLNKIADTFAVQEFDIVISQAQRYKDVEKLQILLQGFDKKENIFNDWKTLKKYYELTQLLAKTEILEKLQELKKQGKEKLYKYIETLAFHPNIDMQKVFMFWQNPEEFLDIKEIHASDIHELKKPSNYIQIPNLDLTAEDLRDSLVNGDLDKLEDWQPLEIIYTLPKDLANAIRPEIVVASQEIIDLQSEIQRALGKRKEGVPGEAQDPNKLFSELTKLFKTEKICQKNKWKFLDYLNGEINIPAELEVKIHELIYNPSFGLNESAPMPQNPNIITERYRAKINLKSDPEATIAGNDTACCMPYGSGKNNVYTFNPNCAMFVVQRQVGGGKWRTIAQSVLTKDVDIKRNIAEVIPLMQEQNTKLTEVLSEDLLMRAKEYITADNIEVVPNFKENANKNKILRYIYTDFFQEYCRRFAKQENLETNKLIVGKGYTDALDDLVEISNTFAPKAPAGYSDNVGRQALELDLTKPPEDIARYREVVFQAKPIREDLSKIKTRGVQNLTFADSLQVAYLEGKAYQDNASLMEYLHNMENGLIAKDINNVSKERPNLSLKYIDAQNKMQGYLLAYEGQDDKGESAIYIADLAANPESNTAGGRLIKEFINLYQEHYLSRENLMPILARAREKTSYAIIKNQLDKIGVDSGVRFNIEELGEEVQGGDVMHNIKIIPQKR